MKTYIERLDSLVGRMRNSANFIDWDSFYLYYDLLRKNFKHSGRTSFPLYPEFPHILDNFLFYYLIVILGSKVDSSNFESYVVSYLFLSNDFYTSYPHTFEEMQEIERNVKQIYDVLILFVKEGVELC